MKKITKNQAAIVLLALVMVIGGFTYFLLWRSRHSNDSSLETSKLNDNSIGQLTKGDPTDATSPGSLSDRSDDSVKDKDKKRASSSTLKLPAGNFVSSHEGLQQDSMIASSCVTTPGATCTIRFTKKDKVLSLPIQNTDKEGATYWEWTPKQIGLAAGTWRIEAIAKLNSHTKTAQDALVLKVEP